MTTGPVNWDRIAEASLTGDATLLERSGRHRGGFRQWGGPEYIGRHSVMRAIREASVSRPVTPGR